MTTVAAAPDGGSAEPSSEATPVTARSPEATNETHASDADNASDGNRAAPLEASGAAGSADFEAPAALPQVLKIVGTVVAPTTLLTALMFHFGLMFAVAYFGYFGANWTVLDLPVQDYLILSVTSALIPLICAAGATLLVLLLYQLPLDGLSAAARRVALRALMPGVAVAGVFLVVLAMVDTWYPVFTADFPREGRGLSLSIGVLLLSYSARLRRKLTAERRSVQAPRRVPAEMVVAKWGAVFILVSVGLFWAVSSYAINVGKSEAQGLATDLRCEADVVLYSEKSMNLQAPGVREVIGQNPDAAYRFRYEGLKLVPQSGNMYLFVPASWTYSGGVAMLLPRSDKLRLEFSQPVAMRNGEC